MAFVRHLFGRPLVAVLAAALLLIGPAPGRADQAGNAQSFIEGLADQAIAALTPPELSRPERERRARVLLNENFAVPTIAQFVLGRYWRTMTEDERKEYLRLFEDLIVETYVDRFSRYSGEGLKVTRTVPEAEGGDFVVYSQINRPAGSPIDVGWRVRKHDPSFKVVDVYVEGVSMGQTQRSEFASVIRNNGGTVSALLAEMRRRIQQPT
jgi:phospholipid transport system substrate-binding protein